MAEFTNFQMRSYETAAGSEEDDNKFIDNVKNAFKNWPADSDVTQDQKDQIVILSGKENSQLKVIVLVPLRDGQVLNVSWNPEGIGKPVQNIRLTLLRGHIGSCP